MFEAHEEVVRRLGIQNETRVLDVGGAGARFPFGTTTIADIQEPNWDAERYHRVDICREPLPFDDNEFDVCLCTQTLEDLYNPFLPLDEIRRVAKRGYIETPHRGLESNFSLSSHMGMFPGWGHHRWMFEDIGNSTIKVVPKFWQLMRHEAEQIVVWNGPTSFSFYWEGTFQWYNAESIDREGHGWDALLDDHNEFVANHREWIQTLADHEAKSSEVKRPELAV